MMIPKTDLIVFGVCALICWSIGAWLFWKWDIGAYRSEWEERHKKESQ